MKIEVLPATENDAEALAVIAAATFALLAEGPPPLENGGTALELEKLYVLPEFHGKGIAGALRSIASTISPSSERRVLPWTTKSMRISSCPAP